MEELTLFERLQKFEAYIPQDLNQAKFFMAGVFVVLAFVLFRYFAVNSVWLVFHFLREKLKIRFFQKRYLYPKNPETTQIKFEIKWSLMTAILFSIFGVVMGLLWQNGYTQIYLSFDQYGYFYLALSWFILAVVHDFYFYVTHVLLHHPYFYKKFHQIHHESLTPTAWASFSFHPVEGLLQAMILPIICLILPLHPVVILAHLTLMTVTAAINHGGYELYPSWLIQNPVTKWWLGATHHSQHHRFYKYNYGLFFTWWDVLFKTQAPSYDQTFQQKTQIES